MPDPLYEMILRATYSFHVKFIWICMCLHFCISAIGALKWWRINKCIFTYCSCCTVSAVEFRANTLRCTVFLSTFIHSLAGFSMLQLGLLRIYFVLRHDRCSITYQGESIRCIELSYITINFSLNISSIQWLFCFFLSSFRFFSLDFYINHKNIWPW